MRAAPHKPTDGVPWLIQLLLVVQQAKDTIFRRVLESSVKSERLTSLP